MFTKIKGKLALLALLVITPYSVTQAAYLYTDITFNEYGESSHPEYVPFGSASSVTPGNFVSTAQGYNFTPTEVISGDPFNDLHLANNYTGATEAGGSYPSNGSVVLGAHYDLQMDRADGGLFSLYSIEFGGYIEGLAAMEGSFKVRGFYGAGGYIDQDFTSVVDGAPGFQSLSFGEGWEGLDSVVFVHWDGDTPGATDQGSFALDNIRVSAVPVPPALLMFVPGLLGLGMVARRKKA